MKRPTLAEFDAACRNVARLVTYEVYRMLRVATLGVQA